MLAQLVAKLGLDAKPFNQGMSKVSGSMKKSGRKMASNLKGQLAGVFALGFLSKASSEALQFAKDVKTFSHQIGLTTDEFQKMDYLFKTVGADTNDVVDAFGTLADKMHDAIGGSEGVREDFRLIGLESGKMKNLTAMEALYAFADAAAKTDDKSRVLTATIRTFGDDLGRRVLPLISEGSEALREMAAASGDFAISEESINSLDDASKKLAALTAANRSWFGEFLGNLTGFATGFVEVFKGLIIAPISGYITGLGAIMANISEGNWDVGFWESFGGGMEAVWDDIEKNRVAREKMLADDKKPEGKFIGQGLDFKMEAEIKALEKQVQKRKEALGFAKLTTAEQQAQLKLQKEQAEAEIKALRETGKPEDKKKALELEMKAMEAAGKLSKSTAGGGASRSMTSAQQIGALVRSPQGLINLAKQQLVQQKAIAANTKATASAKSGDSIYPN
jgi:hypothetical protein